MTITSHSLLKQKLTNIKKLFDIETLLKTPMDTLYTTKYYKTNKLAYTLFHSSSGHIHMGLSDNESYSPSDLLAPAKIVSNAISEYAPNNILELATGRGATSLYLAQKYPDKKFVGIDISPTQLEQAENRVKKAKNYSVTLRDYHDLSSFPTESFDLVFIIEALCYTQDKERVLQEARRILSPKGHFIIIDGYMKDKKLLPDEQLAIDLAGRGMAVGKFESYEKFLKKVERANFSVIVSNDVSVKVMPTLRKLERIAKFFTMIPFAARFLIKLFPPEFTYNTITALLLPTIMELELGTYNITILRK